MLLDASLKFRQAAGLPYEVQPLPLHSVPVAPHEMWSLPWVLHRQGLPVHSLTQGHANPCTGIL